MVLELSAGELFARAAVMHPRDMGHSPAFCCPSGVRHVVKLTEMSGGHYVAVIALTGGGVLRDRHVCITSTEPKANIAI